MSIFRSLVDDMRGTLGGARDGMGEGFRAVIDGFSGAPPRVGGGTQAPPPVRSNLFAPPRVGGFGMGGIADIFAQRFGGGYAPPRVGGFGPPSLGGGFGPPLGGGFRPPSLGRPKAPTTSPTSATPTGGTGATGADPGTDKWRGLIDEAAAQYGIDGDAIQAVMMIESGGNEGARSVAGAMGLMQVMPFHFGAGEDGMDPRTNVMKGAKILADNLKRYGSWDKAVAAYLGAIDANGNITSAQDANGTDGFKYAAMFNANLARIKAARQQQGGGGRAPVNAEGTAFPVQGFQGQVQLHWGEDMGAADLFAAAGTPVAAMRGGKVVSAGYSDIGGWNVTIQGEDGLTYYYAHLQNRPSVSAGQAIAGGTIFGAVGDTGNAKGTGAHLHLGIGYGIQSGTGPRGGSGINFNATEYLQRVLGMQARR